MDWVENGGMVEQHVNLTPGKHVHNEYPLKPHFYIVKLGYAGIYLFFLFLLQNINVLSKNIKSI